MPPWICIASRVTHSAARHTYAFNMEASSVPSPWAIRRATWYDDCRVAAMMTAIRPSLACVS